LHRISKGASNLEVRTHDNLFSTHLPIFKQEKIGAYNWGLVAGKTWAIVN
jgi:hypothetical protein